ncbi:MAG TPA: helix-turn-helix domain-containing protein [Acidobacteriota bacterium]|nr:helix-turn-helix domain-containing protein [Acidobacteriota bacterium]
MIVGKDFLGKLKDFGLNSYEVKLWVALLSRGVSTAGELSDIANVPRSRTYDVLESLEKKGFIVLKIGKPIKYMAIEPDRVVEVLKKNIAAEAKTREEIVESIKESEVLKELKSLHTHGIEHVDSSELSASIRGRSNMYGHLETTISGAEKSVTILTTTRGLIDKVEALKPVLEKVKKRGVKIRIAAPITKECAQAVADMANIAEIRNTTFAGRFILVDGKEIMFMVLDDAQVHPTYDVGIWVNTPFFTQSLEDLFELAWKEMKPVKEITK